MKDTRNSPQRSKQYRQWYCYGPFVTHWFKPLMLIVWLGLSMTLNGCGQKGPLVLPGDGVDEKKIERPERHKNQDS